MRELFEESIVLGLGEVGFENMKVVQQRVLKGREIGGERFQKGFELIELALLGIAEKLA